MLRDLKQRGMNAPRLVVADGHLGIWAALAQVYPQVQEQRCWNHRILNVLDQLPKKVHRTALPRLRQIPYTGSRREAERLKAVFQRWCRQHGYDQAAELLDRDWDRMVSFYGFPQAHWPHLGTTNPVESPFAALRLRTDAARRFRKVANARAVIWKMLLVAEQRFRRLKAPHLLKGLYRGDQYVDGVPVKTANKEEVAA